ncbi:hypothetical protein NPIL_567131 [Nephila pilipes]|uniref:Uncharacterized protein n=1 Tax=Nephila pilipes TaxID=299642 RepID=A0A8X6TSR7_NEPPI|nr:hypothetical protein NPIL_567131 [Nephila pilipes]
MAYIFSNDRHVFLNVPSDEEIQFRMPDSFDTDAEIIGTYTPTTLKKMTPQVLHSTRKEKTRKMRKPKQKFKEESNTQRFTAAMFGADKILDEIELNERQKTKVKWILRIAANILLRSRSEVF